MAYVNGKFLTEGNLVQVDAPGLTIGLLHPREGQDSHPGKSGSVHIGLEVEELESAIKLQKSRGVEFQPIMEKKQSESHRKKIATFGFRMLVRKPC